MSATYVGRRFESVIVDEWWALSPPPVTIKPLDIPCKACGAQPGHRCTKTHRRHGKIGYRGYHFRRKDDARLATEAVRALNSG
jgi:hypothetical protein